MAEKIETSKIKAFGKLVDRDQAHQIIVNDRVCEICYAGFENALRDLLLDGWKPLDEWSDEELEHYIEGLCPENQPDGASEGCSL
ncbi:MAG: hypothetical protein WC931_03740 [Bacilli bacterium]|jgi:hypothetical protein